MNKALGGSLIKWAFLNRGNNVCLYLRHWSPLLAKVNTSLVVGGLFTYSGIDIGFISGDPP